jgi:hypothetical protein
LLQNYCFALRYSYPEAFTAANYCKDAINALGVSSGDALTDLVLKLQLLEAMKTDAKLLSRDNFGKHSAVCNLTATD